MTRTCDDNHSITPNEVKRVQGVSEGGATFSAARQVNEACENIKSSLVNLIEGVQVFNTLSSGPKLETAQEKNNGAFRRKGFSGVKWLGAKWDQTLMTREESW
ncbi:hypothetical protein PHAVU_010G004100 [Phaseolus vulgaris]|uniref:Uncharacterized protein n=1 Tax=Phaseolus vulgaris TaxID=3885 RepID=V7ANX7_PHAVU|nr:hypothetical protein PHAVU_010G004100g [Phaseolus vulgaris]ESW05921.1 hypothetical protein PHAVU_010G004100g [Phaseolus vulgaris]